MELAAEILLSEPDVENWKVVSDWTDLDLINENGINLALWDRSPLEISDTLAEIEEKQFDHFQLVLDRGDDSTIVAAALDDQLNLQSPSATHFYCDLIDLTQRFFQISRANEIGFRLETISTDACSYFHVDLVTLRLVCTYRGPGSEWLLNKDVNRGGLFKQSNDLVQKIPSRVRKLQPFQVGIMKGEKFPQNAGNGLVHRSPAIAGTNQSRLFLRMDALS